MWEMWKGGNNFLVHLLGILYTMVRKECVISLSIEFSMTLRK